MQNWTVTVMSVQLFHCHIWDSNACITFACASEDILPGQNLYVRLNVSTHKVATWHLPNDGCLLVVQQISFLL